MTTLTQLTSGQGGKHVTVNNNNSALSPAAAFGRRVEAITGLTWAYYGGTVWAGEAFHALADSTLALTASATNYVELVIEGSGSPLVPYVDVNTTAFTAGAIPLYEITTDGSGITAETDRRMAINFDKRAPDLQYQSYAAAITPNARGGRYVVVGTLTGAITINAPVNAYTGASLVFVFTQEGGSPDPLHAVTWNAVFNTPTDAGGNADQTGGVEFVYDGSAWVQIGAPLEWN